MFVGLGFAKDWVHRFGRGVRDVVEEVGAFAFQDSLLVRHALFRVRDVQSVHKGCINKPDILGAIRFGVCENTVQTLLLAVPGGSFDQVGRFVNETVTFGPWGGGCSLVV